MTNLAAVLRSHALAIGRHIFVVLIALLFVASLIVAHPTAGLKAQVPQNAVVYQPGWALVGYPMGTTLVGTAGGVAYTLTADGSAYRSVPIGAVGEQRASGLAAGQGYWAYFPQTTTIPIPPSGPLPLPGPTHAGQSFVISVPPGVFTMIGNPYSTTVTVSGGAYLLTFDGQSYQMSTTLNPGQGGFAYLAEGGRLDICPKDQECQ